MIYTKSTEPIIILLLLIDPVIEDFIHDTIFLGPFSAHKMISIRIFRNNIYRLSRMLGEYIVQTGTNFQGFFSMYGNIRSLTLYPAQWLVDHNSRIGKTITFAWGTASQQ